MPYSRTVDYSGTFFLALSQAPTGGLPGTADGSLTGANVSSAPTSQMVSGRVQLDC